MSPITTRLEASRHIHFVDMAPQPKGPDWVQSFYESLLRQSGIATDVYCLRNGKNNDFFAMGRAVLASLQEGTSINDVSCLFIAHQTFDTYYPFQSVATLLCNEFNIEAPAVVMTEQEFTTPYIALSAMLATLRKAGANNSGLLLIFDQATLPYTRFSESIDTALAIKISTTPIDHNVIVDGARFWYDGGGPLSDWIDRNVKDFIGQRHISISDVQVITDNKLRDQMSARLATQSVDIIDERFMSAAGLISAFQLMDRNAAPVLLIHLSRDKHLYLYLFDTEVLAEIVPS